MTAKPLYLLIGILSSAPAIFAQNATPSCVEPPAGLVAWWTANQPEAGEMFGRPTFGGVLFAPGKVGQAFHFAEQSGFLNVGGGEDFNLANFSVEAWVRRSDTTKTAVKAGANPGGNICGYNESWSVVVADDGRVMLMDRTYIAGTSSTAITNLNWHHIAVARSGQSIAIYIDGVAAGTAEYPEFPRGEIFHLSGQHNGLGGYNTFLGDIDELSIYNQAISAEEVARVYNAQEAGKCSTDVAMVINPPIVRVAAGTAVPINVQLSSRGQPAATNVVVSLTSANGAVFSALTPSRGEAESSASTVQWRAGTMSDGEARTLTLNAALSAPGVHYINASVAADTLDVRLTNNLATTRIDIFGNDCFQAPEGLIAFYNGESFDDFLGGGTLQNVSGVTLVPGWKGSAFGFNGVMGQGLKSLAEIPPLSNFTIQMWVMSSGGGLLFNSNNGGLQAGLTATGEMYFAGDSVSFSTAGIRDDQWHHVAWTKQEGTLMHYLDGLAVKEQPVDPAMQMISPFAIGVHGELSGLGFVSINGAVDEFALFNRALTGAEIGAVFLAGPLGVCAQDISIAATMALGTVPLGETNLLRLSITNRGTVDAQSVVVTNAFPAGVEILSVTGANPTATSPGLFLGDVGLIPTGAAHEIVFTVRATTPGAKQIDLTVGRNDYDLSANNNAARVTFSAEPLTVSVGPNVSISEPDSGSANGSFTLTLNLPSEVERTVYFHWNDATAVNGVDYQPTTNKFVFLPGATNGQVAVDVLGDILYEGDEFFQLELDATNTLALGASIATGRIVEDDPAPSIRVSHIVAVEGAAARFQISVVGEFVGQLKIPFYTTNLTAAANVDYQSTNGTLSFTRDARAQTIAVPITADGIAEPNETFALILQTPTGLLQPQCVIIDKTAANPALKWSEIPDGLSATDPLPAALSAVRTDGSTDTSFNGPAQFAVVQGIAHSPLVFTELDLALRDTVELQNVSSNSVNLSGWKVYFYDATTWPAPVAVFSFPDGFTLASKAVTLLSEGGVPRPNGFAIGQLLAWADSNTNHIAAVLLDDAFGNTHDFVALNVGDTSEILDPHPVDEAAWNGLAINAAVLSGNFQRSAAATANHRSPEDWSARLPTIGVGLPAVFTDGDLLPVSPSNVQLANGAWSGSISSLPIAGPLTLVAIDSQGRVSYSNPFIPALPNDLSVSLSRPGGFVYGGLGTSISLTVTNPGPDIAANVVADLFVPTPLLSSAATITASQGTAARQNAGGDNRYRGTFGNIPPGSAAILTLNIPALPTRFDVFSTDPTPFIIHGNTTNLVGDPNLSNNSVIAANEISKPAVFGLGNPVAWWPAELNTLDATETNPLQAIGSVQYVPGRVGYGFKLDAADSLATANHPSLNFGADDEFWVEFWLRVDRLPADGIIDLIRKLPDDPSQTAVGWRLFIERGMLRLYYRDSQSAQPVFLQVPLPRFEPWLYVSLTGSKIGNSRTLTLFIPRFGSPTVSAQAQVNPGDLANSAPLIIGGSLSGVIDELAIFKGPFPAPRPNVFTAGPQGKAPAGIDSDGDGVPNAWTVAAASGLLPSWADLDGDGSPNWHEFIAGTSPADPAHVLKLSHALRPDGRLELRFTAMPSHFYSIEKTTTLNGVPNWTTIRSRISVNTSNVQTVLPAVPVDGFYRISLSN